MFTFNARALKKYYGIKILGETDSETEAILSGFVDRSTVSDWARGFVATNVKQGIVSGSPVDGGLALNPTSPIIRAEVAVVLDESMQ